ncbi:MAG: hypothetical protein ACYC2K_17580 [Gemmatimonadales bacterium]
MKKQRGLFEEGEGGSEGILRRLVEEVRVRATEMLADLAIRRAGARRKGARDER